MKGAKRRRMRRAGGSGAAGRGEARRIWPLRGGVGGREEREAAQEEGAALREAERKGRRCGRRRRRKGRRCGSPRGRGGGAGDREDWAGDFAGQGGQEIWFREDFVGRRGAGAGVILGRRWRTLGFFFPIWFVARRNCRCRREW